MPCVEGRKQCFAKSSELHHKLCRADIEDFEDDQHESDDEQTAMHIDNNGHDRQNGLSTVPENAEGDQSKDGAQQAAEPLPDASLCCLQSHSEAVMSGACDDLACLQRWRDGAQLVA
jgi:hypothetical protein